MRYGHDGSIEAPTHLGSHQLPLPPEWLSDDDEISESVTRARLGSEPKVIVATQSQSASRSKSRSKAVSRSKATPAPLPPPPAAPAPAPEAMAVPPGMTAIDPLSVPVPPELGTTIYSWIRRLALQADLNGADRVLRDALLDITSSLSVSIVYPGQDGLWTLGADEEIPREAQPIIAVAQARKAIVTSHSALVPVVTTSETVAVVILTRNPRNPAYHPIETIAMIALARESAAIMHHLAITHLQRQSEIKADKGGLYRGEALEAHRTRGNEGSIAHLSPTWVRRTYPFLVVAMLAAILVSIFITVPTYSTGMAVVVFDGARITAPAVGTADKVVVVPGQSVRQGDLLVRLKSYDQEAELQQATAELEAAIKNYLFEGDEQARKSLASAMARQDRASAAVEARVIRAPKAGTVSDIRVKDGDLLNPGSHILTIVEPGTEPEILAFLPGKDRPRVRKNMKIQVELVGFTKTREMATIETVGTEIVGGEEAARFIGSQLADSLKLQGGNYVIVKGRLPGRTFKAEHKTMNYHHGLMAKTEVKVSSKPFLVTLLPALEKYLPE